MGEKPELAFFLSGSWVWFVIGAQEQLWSDDLPDTTNEPDGIQSSNPQPIDHEPQVISTEPPLLP